MHRPNRTVLIIDDEPADRLTYRRYLACDPAHDYTVVEAEHGDQALALCREMPPDCIILDYRLPYSDGLAVLQMLAAAAYPHLYPVVMLTGAGNTAVAVQAIQSGVHDYLSKEHITPEQLQRAVNNAMEKVALQRALVQQREWFRVALTSIGDAVIATDTAGSITFLNPAAEMLTGWTLLEAQDRPLMQVFQIINETTRQAVSNPVDTVLQTGATVVLADHTLLITKDGQEIPIDDSAAPIRNEQGNLLGVILVFRDMTERRRVEIEIVTLNHQLTQRVQELRTAQNFIQQITDVMPDSLYVYDLVQQRPTYINRNGFRLLGLTPEAMPTQNQNFAASIMHPEDALRFAQYDLTLRKLPDEAIAEFEYRMRSSDSKWRWFRSRDRVFARGADGAVQQIIGVATDITLYRAAEDALRRSEERLQLAFAAAQMGYWEWDIITNQVIWGGHHHQLFGMQPDEFGGTYEAFLALLHPDDRATVEGKVAETLTTGVSHEQEFRIIWPSGEVRWIRSLGKVHRNEDDHPQRLVGIVYDITSLKTAEEALQALNATLETRIAERTDELQNFVNLATHDLRDTVRGIDYLAGWIREDAGHLLPAPSQQHLRNLCGRVRRLEEQLGDLLAYARAGRQEDALRRVETDVLVAEITQGLMASTGFFVTIEPPMPVLVTQRAALETVLRHLIDNAMKHHHQPQQGRLHIAAKLQADWIEFIVTDDGPGIAPQHQALIFDMFRTLQPRDQAKGNGVGLAIAKKVVESWGGRLIVESAVGQGSTFRFTWPRT